MKLNTSEQGPYFKKGQLVEVRGVFAEARKLSQHYERRLDIQARSLGIVTKTSARFPFDITVYFPHLKGAFETVSYGLDIVSRDNALFTEDGVQEG